MGNKMDTLNCVLWVTCKRTCIVVRGWQERRLHPVFSHKAQADVFKKLLIIRSQILSSKTITNFFSSNSFFKLFLLCGRKITFSSLLSLNQIEMF